MIGETVRDHSLGNGVGPTNEDTSGGLVIVACKAESANGDKRIATPIGKPRVAGNDRFSVLSFDDVLLGGTFDAGDFLASIELLVMHDFKDPFGR